MQAHTDRTDIRVTLPGADETTATGADEGGIHRRPEPIGDDDSWPGTRWLFRWLRVIVMPGRERCPHPTVARLLRWPTYALVGAGLVFAKLTAQRIVPISIQVVVVAAVLTFSLVGFWMVRWPDARTNVIGWTFCSAGALGASIYALATYSNLAVGKHWMGGVAAGWAADMLFLPSMSLFASFLLASIPTGHWNDSRGGRRTVVSGVAAAGFLLVGMALGPHLVSYPGATRAQPAGDPLAGWWWLAVVLGLASLLVSIVVGFDAARKNRSMVNASKWYGYGGAFALFALVPYLVVTFAEWQTTPAARSAARAGVAALALIAVAAIPATVEEPWRPARMKRLVRGVVIAATAAAIHEVMVHTAVGRVVGGTEGEPQLGGQFVFTYELVLIAIAVLFEPFQVAFDAVFERFRYWSSPAHDVLEEGLDDLRASRARLNRAMARAVRLAELAAARGHDGTPRHEARWERATREIDAVLADIRQEHAEAASLIDRIEGEMPKLAPT